ncbi:hypothetical protein STRIP9103_04508 [Streptomyces ipomoeae 91-03]|uniref:Uncharacterized protein n=1 Tax=Streptomyces ipomoeae 91-03 TaxID=698759 RepID=L1KPX5_9ACTN|nr:hypothetical protein STRIP9103_04508 [Streptomyces ipomoeae 91-03]
MISSGNGHAYAKPSGVSSARARQLRDSHTTASMRSATARESTRHTARSVMAPGKWDQTIYHHTHPPPPKANRAHNRRSATPLNGRRTKGPQDKRAAGRKGRGAVSMCGSAATCHNKPASAEPQYPPPRRRPAPRRRPTPPPPPQAPAPARPTGPLAHARRTTARPTAPATPAAPARGTPAPAEAASAWAWTSVPPSSARDAPAASPCRRPSHPSAASPSRTASRAWRPTPKERPTGTRKSPARRRGSACRARPGTPYRPRPSPRNPRPASHHRSARRTARARAPARRPRRSYSRWPRRRP